MAKVKFFSKVGQSLRSRSWDQKFGTDRKVSPQGKQVRNMKALSLSVQKLLPRLSFFESRSQLMVKVTRSKILVLTQWSRHREYRSVI